MLIWFQFLLKEETTVKGEEIESPIKIVGVVEKQLVVRINAKRRLLFCNDENMLDEITEMIPTAGHGTLVQNTLVKFEQRELDEDH